MTNRCLDWRVGLLGHNSYWESNNCCQQTLPLLPVAECSALMQSIARVVLKKKKKKIVVIFYFSVLCLFTPLLLHFPPRLTLAPDVRISCPWENRWSRDLCTSSGFGDACKGFSPCTDYERRKMILPSASTQLWSWNYSHSALVSQQFQI